MSAALAGKLRSAAEAAAMVPDGATVAISGAGGGLLEPEALLAAIEQRHLAGRGPRGLTLVHAQGLGDGQHSGLNRLAYAGLIKRVIGSHWGWSPRMQALAADEQIEAYALPGGAIQHLVRESGARRPGLITPIGLGTIADPRREGGRMNASAREALSEIVRFDGRDYIRYKPLPIDVAIVRGSVADPAGNISFDEEGAELDALVLAMAAHNAGGRVLAQVRALVAPGEIAARRARLPGALVDALVVDPEQRQSHASGFDARLTGAWPRPHEALMAQGAPGVHAAPAAPTAHAAQAAHVQRSTAVAPERQVIGWRAFQELRAGSVASFGLGVPDEVSRLAALHAAAVVQTVDHGHYGGYSLEGALFGFVRDGEAMIDSPSQFDFYSGGGIDIAFLGFGEFDRHGDVNVSRLGGRINGPGGFIDITQGSGAVVFCGSFETQGLQVALEGGGLRIVSPGRHAKVVERVEQVTFSAARGRELGQQVLYVTERAVFRLGEEGVVLEELAPGVDLRTQVLDRMGFVPLMQPTGPRAMMLPAPLPQDTRGT